MFCDFAFDCNLVQLVNSPTHSMGNCLDLVLTNSPESVGHIDISSHPLIQSDHFIISFSLVISAHLSSSQTTTYVPNLSKLNYDELAEYLLGVDFSASLLSTDVEFIWDQLRSTVLDGIDLKAPKIKLNPKKHSPYWFNSKVRHQINCVRTIRRRISCNPTASRKCKLQEAELKL